MLFCQLTLNYLEGMEMATDFPSAFSEECCLKMVGFDMARAATNKLYIKTGVQPQDVDVVELHDCFSCNELITYEALGLCPIGKVLGQGILGFEFVKLLS